MPSCHLNHAQPDKLFLVDVWGASMEPTLYQGDVVLVDTTRNQLNIDGIYVFRDNDMLFVKRIVRQINGRIIVKSDNTRYEPYSFDPDAGGSKVFGKVVWYARTII